MDMGGMKIYGYKDDRVYVEGRARQCVRGGRREGVGWGDGNGDG
jgi:hypothetical protein